MSQTAVRTIDAATVTSVVPPLSLIEPLTRAFRSGVAVAPRAIHAIGTDSRAADLLVMPAWQPGRHLGVKLVTVVPANNERGLPSINASYQLFSAETGLLEAIIDANALTEMRTAAISVLGRRLMTNGPVDTMLMIGAGALAPHVVAAHVDDADPKTVLVWNRTTERADRLVATLARRGTCATRVDNLEQAVRRADLICCAATDATPLIAGRWIADGAHLNLIGSYRRDMREADADAIDAGAIVVDTAQALTEAGDLVDAINRGTISKDGVPTVADMLGGAAVPDGRITIFKSVGSAIADLAAAQALIERLPDA